MIETLFDDFENRGLAKGLAKGLARGRAQGMAEAVLALIAARHLTLSEDARHRIAACEDVDRLQRWLLRAATVTTGDEVVNDS